MRSRWRSSLPYLSRAGFKDEAGVAAVGIAEQIVASHPAEVAEAMKQIQTNNEQLAERVRQVLAQVPAGATEAGFTPIFNGNDLTGWDGKPGWWKVEDGALTAESTPEKPCKECNYLIWRGGQPSDFELIADFRLSGAGNSGIQLRSQALPNWDTSGYQADMSGDGDLVGFVYEHTRGLIAGRGERVSIGPDGKREVQELGDAAELGEDLQEGSLEHLPDHLPRSRDHAVYQRHAHVPVHGPRREASGVQGHHRPPDAPRTADEDRVQEHPAEGTVRRVNSELGTDDPSSPALPKAWPTSETKPLKGKMTHRTETLDTVLKSSPVVLPTVNRASVCTFARRCALMLLTVTACIEPVHAARPAMEASARLLAQVEPRIEAIYETDEFHMRSHDATWLPGGSGYLKLETPARASGAENARYDCASGKRTLMVAGENLLVPGTSERLRDPRVRLLADGQACSAAHRRRRAGVIAGCMKRGPGTCVR